MRIFWMTGLVAAGWAGAAGAQATDVTGGELRFGYERLSGGAEGGREDAALSKTSLEGSIDLGFGGAFGTQVDLALDRFNEAGDMGKSMGLHGFYNISPMTRAGVFAGFETVDGASVTYYGGELGVDTGVTEIEGYILAGTEHDSDSSGVLYGIDGAYGVTPQLSLGGRLDIGAFDTEIDVTRLAVTAAFDLTPAAQLQAEIGTTDIDAAGLGRRDDTYIGVRATFTFGPGQGSVFDRRGLLDLIPGG